MKDVYSDYIEQLNGRHLSNPSVQPLQPQEKAFGYDEILQKIDDKLDILINKKYLNREADIIVRGGRVVLPDNGVFEADVWIKNGKVFRLQQRVQPEDTGETACLPSAEIIDARGKYVLPGIIDPHAHLGLFAPLKTDLQSETKSALVGGITTLGVFFGGEQSHVENFPRICEEINQTSYVDIIPHLVIGSQQQKKEIQDCIRSLGVTSYKVYMNGIPGMISEVDDGFILDVFAQLKQSGRTCVLCVHAENSHIVRRANDIVRSEKGEQATIRDWADTHPALAEEEAVMRMACLAERSGVDVYLVHISSKEAALRLQEIKAKNRRVFAETTSPYLSITKEDTESFRIKMEPPFRSSEDREALWRAVRGGVIDTIGTDNVCQTSDEKKAAGSLWDAMPGYPALATHLPVCLHEGVTKRGLSIEELIAHMTKRPAGIFGVYPQKGTLLPGSDADLVIVDMQLERTVEAAALCSRSDFSIYDGKKITGWPVMTIKGGAVVAKDGVYMGNGASGRCLKR